MDGDTRSRAIQTQSETPHAVKLSDEKFHSGAAFLSAHRTQFTKWMRLKENKLDVDACKSIFFDAVDSDLEFSRAAIQSDFSNKWAEEQQLSPGEAANKFSDELRLQAELLDSIENDKKSGGTS